MAACIAPDALSNLQHGGYGNIATEYCAMYQNWPPQDKVSPCPPTNGEFIYDDGANHKMESMYCRTYVNHPIEGRTECIRPPVRNPPGMGEKFQSISTYSDNYRNEKGQRRKPFRPLRVSLQNTEGRSCQKASVNQQTYRLYSIPEFLASRRLPIITKPEKGGVFPSPSQCGIKLQTTAQDSFKVISGALQRRKPIIPTSNGLPHDATMDMLTTNRADYTFKQPNSHHDANVSPLVKNGRLALRRYTTKNSFNSRSTVQDDYINHPLVMRPKSFKPVQQYEASTVPFGNNTLYTDDFMANPPQQRPTALKTQDNIRVCKTNNYVTSTQYQDEFDRPKSVYERPKPYKPKSNRSDSGRFEDCTSYNINYKNNYDYTEAYARNKCKRIQQYKKPDIPMEVKSTAHSHYKGEHAPPSKICKPTTKTFLDDV